MQWAGFEKEPALVLGIVQENSEEYMDSEHQFSSCDLAVSDTRCQTFPGLDTSQGLRFPKVLWDKLMEQQSTI